jgi:glucosamine 6-phosphate synthetase-like amidotransferase/phosphosugar isomerase protein
MCGIIYYKSFHPGKTVNSLVIRHYLMQRERGHEGFGFIGIAGDKIITCRATAESGIVSYLNKYPLTDILFHHRMPTSTTNTIRTTHPIVISQPIYRHRYYFVHNGVIGNDTELKTKHEKMGIKYTTTQLSKYSYISEKIQKRYEFNDSESLAHEMALLLEDRHRKIEAKGDTAFICLVTDRDSNVLKLHFARNNGSPLGMKRTSDYLMIASDGVSDKHIPPCQLYSYDYKTQRISCKKIELPEHELGNIFRDTGNYLQRLELIELLIMEYEDAICRIESLQMKASAEADSELYENLQREKEQYEERIALLAEEYSWLERI